MEFSLLEALNWKLRSSGHESLCDFCNLQFMRMCDCTAKETIKFSFDSKLLRAGNFSVQLEFPLASRRNLERLATLVHARNER